MQSSIVIYNVELVKTVGNGTAQGVKTGTEEVNKWFKGIGEGIEDLGRKLLKIRPRSNASSFAEKKMQAQSSASTRSGKRLVAMSKLVYPF